MLLQGGAVDRRTETTNRHVFAWVRNTVDAVVVWSTNASTSMDTAAILLLIVKNVCLYVFTDLGRYLDPGAGRALNKTFSLYKTCVFNKKTGR